MVRIVVDPDELRDAAQILRRVADVQRTSSRAIESIAQRIERFAPLVAAGVQEAKIALTTVAAELDGTARQFESRAGLVEGAVPLQRAAAAFFDHALLARPKPRVQARAAAHSGLRDVRFAARKSPPIGLRDVLRAVDR